MKDKSYAIFIKTVRQEVGPKKIRVEVKNISKTRNGELLLTVQNGVWSEKMEALKVKITNKMPTLSTSVIINKKGII